MTFLNEMWMWALPLVAAPWIIHYLFRRQKVTRWGAMEILMRVYNKRKKRRRIEELLLLLMRMAIIFLLAFAMMRPELRSNATALSFKNKSVAVVLDTSLSTSRSLGVKTVLDELKDKCIQYINERPVDQDVFLVITPGESVWPSSTREELVEAITEVRPQYLNGRIERVQKAIKEQLRQRNTRECQVEIFSDFQKSDFEGVEEWPSEWEVGFHRVQNMPQKKNYRLIQFKAGAGLPSMARQWNAEVTVEGPAGEVNIHASEGGNSLFKQDVTVPESGRVTVPLKFHFFKEGWHRLELSLSSDAYDFDNKQYMTVRVAAKNRALILSSFKSDDYREDETFFFEAALSPREGEIDIHSTTVPPEVMEGYDLYVLANIEKLSQDVVKVINKEVAQGSMLYVCGGSRVNAEFLKKSFPYLPELQTVQRQPTEFLADTGGRYRLRGSYFKPYRFKNYFTLSERGQAEWRDIDQNIVMSSGSEGKGSWVMSGFSLNFEYGDWVGSPLFLSFARSLVKEFPHPRHVGPQTVCSEGQRPEWSTPGFVNEEGLVVAVNPPENESDLEVVDAKSWESKKSDVVVQDSQTPLALTFLAALLAFLFVETLWNARQS